jgi:hypothetical protein
LFFGIGGKKISFLVLGENAENTRTPRYIHESQLLTYLRLSNIERGLLINFHTYRLAEGIKRLTLRKTT